MKKFANKVGTFYLLIDFSICVLQFALTLRVSEDELFVEKIKDLVATFAFPKI